MGMEGFQNLAEPAVRRWLMVAGILIVVCIAAMVLLSGCSSPCLDNPRNMQCMTADQIERELAGKEQP